MKEYRDTSGRLRIDVADDALMFQVLASRIEARCGGKRVHRLGGLDQSYWDYDVEGTLVVLHSDVFAGVSLHVEDGSQDDLLRRVAARITEPDASPNHGPPKGLGNSHVGDGPPFA